MKMLSLAARITTLALLPAVVVAQTADIDSRPDHDIRVSLEGHWLTASFGSDENAQVIQLKVWGSLREPSKFVRRFEQLDDDIEEEYVVISRNVGTGPYYKLQVLDFHSDGIRTWSYDSFGQPKIENKRIYLGKSRQYRGAGDVPDYIRYEYTTRGLVPAK